MYASTEKGRQINRFIYVAIPRPSDIFKRMGMRRINSQYSCAKGQINDIPTPTDLSEIGKIRAGEQVAKKILSERSEKE